jgi:hypothetical protein
LLALLPETVAVAVRARCATRPPSILTPHVDVPFHSDATVGVVARVSRTGPILIDAFRAQLDAVSFDERLVL